MTWQSGLMRVTRNHVPSGAQVRILVSSGMPGRSFKLLVQSLRQVSKQSLNCFVKSHGTHFHEALR